MARNNLTMLHLDIINIYKTKYSGEFFVHNFLFTFISAIKLQTSALVVMLENWSRL